MSARRAKSYLLHLKTMAIERSPRPGGVLWPGPAVPAPLAPAAVGHERWGRPRPGKGVIRLCLRQRRQSTGVRPGWPGPAKPMGPRIAASAGFMRCVAGHRAPAQHRFASGQNSPRQLDAGGGLGAADADGGFRSAR